MKTREAIIKRIEEICVEQNRTAGDICLSGEMTPSTYYDFKNGRTKVISVETIKKICFGAGITLENFFSRDYFNDYE